MQIVVAYRGIPHAPGWAIGASLARGFRRLGHTVYEYGNYYQTDERLSSDAPPKSADLLVYCECNDADPQYTELKHYNARWKVYWNFDVHSAQERTFSLMRKIKFTHVFFGNKLYEEIFTALCPLSYYLPIGVDDERYRPLPEVEKNIAVGLCGSLYPERVQLVEELRRAGITAELMTNCYQEEYVRAINQFHIHLNYGVGGGRGLLPGRIWETLGCRTLLLAERADSIELFFNDMHQVALYDSREECISKAQYLLDNPHELRAITEGGYRSALENHTYVHRAQSILDAVFDNKTLSWQQRVTLSTFRKVALQLHVLMVLIRSNSGRMTLFSKRIYFGVRKRLINKRD